MHRRRSGRGCSRPAPDSAIASCAWAWPSTHTCPGGRYDACAGSTRAGGGCSRQRASGSGSRRAPTPASCAWRGRSRISPARRRSRRRTWRRRSSTGVSTGTAGCDLLGALASTPVVDVARDMAIEFVDCDAHLVEGALAPQCIQRWPEVFAVSPEGELLTEGRRYPESRGPGAGCPPEHGLTSVPGANPFSIEGMLADADRDGIDRLVFFPSFGLRGPTIENRSVARAFCEFYNEWCADWCARGKGRFFGVAIAPVEWVDDAVAVIKRARQLGLVGAMIPPALKTRNLDHPDLDPLYRTAVDLDLPLGVHGAPGIHLPKIGVDRFTNYIQVHCVS